MQLQLDFVPAVCGVIDGLRVRIFKARLGLVNRARLLTRA